VKLFKNEFGKKKSVKIKRNILFPGLSAPHFFVNKSMLPEPCSPTFLS